MAMSISVAGRWPDFELHLGDRRLDIWQELRVVLEQFDIVALAMINLKHHRGPTAEGPSALDVTVAVRGNIYSESFFKKIFPARGRRRHARNASS